jgi:drug/metabolite transporter (DMT)-like permease
MFYVWALVAIIGAVGYQYFVKRVPAEINPIVSVLGLYAGVLAMAALLLPLFPSPVGLAAEVRKLNWVQIALAVSVLLIEIGFLMMYRSGWELSSGNLVTGVVVNIALVGLGVWLLGERLSTINLLGIALSIVGVGLISYRA